MNRVLAMLVLAALLSPHAVAHSWSPWVNIEEIALDDSGDLLVRLSDSHNDTTCSSDPDDLTQYRLKKANTNIYDTAAALIITAMAQDKKIQFLGQGCSGALVTLSYLRIEK